MALWGNYEEFLVHCCLSDEYVSHTVHTDRRILGGSGEELGRAASIPFVWVCDRAAISAVVPFKRVEAMVMLPIRRPIQIAQRERFQERERLGQIMYIYESTFNKRIKT